MVKAYGFRKEEKLRKPSEFQQVLASGRRITTPHFVLFVHHKDSRGRRLGISVSRKVGGAVQRNRMKRLLREVFRLNKHDLPDGIDIVIIVKKAGDKMKRDDVAKELLGAIGSLER